MRNKVLNLNHPSSVDNSKRGFTLIELMVGSSIMLIIILGTLSLYVKSNKISVDQQQLAEIQHDVRAGMFFISRDVRMAGVGLPIEFSGYFLEGFDNEDQQGAVAPDRLRLMGNMEDPLNLKILNYPGNSAANVELEDYSFEQFPYPDDYFDNKFILILPRPDSGCQKGAVRQVTHLTHSTGGTTERINMSHGLAKGINPPGGLSGECDQSTDYDGGAVTFIEVKEYWLDVTGNYQGLVAGQDGYIGNGQGSILYLTQNGVHYPLAKNIESLQFQYNYNGDLDDDGNLDGFIDWDNNNWTINPGDDEAVKEAKLEIIARIRQVKIWVLGRTERPFVSVSGTPSTGIHHYRRPAVANSTTVGPNDKHRRFLLESTSTIRNLALSLYNTGTR